MKNTKWFIDLSYKRAAKGGDVPFAEYDRLSREDKEELFDITLSLLPFLCSSEEGYKALLFLVFLQGFDNGIKCIDRIKHIPEQSTVEYLRDTLRDYSEQLAAKAKIEENDFSGPEK